MNSVYELSRYLIIKVLVGKRYIVEAVYEYIVLNRSPKQIADKYGLTVNQVRGYIQRVLEKAMSFHRARALLKHLYPFIAALEPVVVNGFCLLCGSPIPFGAEEHVRAVHGDIVDLYAEKVVESLLHTRLAKRVEVVA